MAIVLDYTARIAPSALRAAGVSGVCRYVAPQVASTTWKRIGVIEYRELVAAGIDVTLNWEYDSRDWLGGAERGASHGRQAAAAARTLGYPTGAVIIGSADFDMARAQWLVAGEAYARSFAAAVRAGGYRPGVYGPWDVLTWVRDEGIMDAFWQAGMSAAWSGGRNARPWPGAHLRQRGHRTIAGQDCDWNDVLIPSWGARTVEGDDMADSWTQPLTQGTEGYAGQQRDTALAFAWRSANEANIGVQQLLAAAAADEQRDNVTLAAVKALAVASGADPRPILDAIAAARTETHDLVLQLQQQLAAAQTHNARLAQALAAAGVALAEADDDPAAT